MKIDVNELSSIQKKIHVELPAEAVNQEFLRVYENLGRRVKIKGFRPGKTPHRVLKGLYGDEVKGQVLSQLVENSLREVFKERKLEVVSRPEVEANDLEEGKAFTFSALVEVKPDVEVKDYWGLELEKAKVLVQESQVEATLKRLQDSRAQLEPVEDRDVVADGDYVILDFAGFVDGNPLPGAKTENYHLEVGGGTALPQFEEGVVGLKKGEERTIRVPYPEDHYNRDLAGKVVEFSVTVREIKKKILPPLDDAFAKDHGECGSLDELKSHIRGRLEDELRKIQEEELKEKIVTRLIETHPFTAPQALVERQLQYLSDRYQSQLAAQDASRSTEKPSLEQLRKDLEPRALRQVKGMLLVEKVATREKIEVSDTEIQARIDQLVRSAGERGTTVRDIYNRPDVREDLRSQMVFERTLDALLQRATIKEAESPAP